MSTMKLFQQQKDLSLSPVSYVTLLLIIIIHTIHGNISYDVSVRTSYNYSETLKRVGILEVCNALEFCHLELELSICDKEVAIFNTQ